MATAMHSAHFECAAIDERMVKAMLDRADVERAREEGRGDLVIELSHDSDIATLEMSWSPEDLDALLASTSEDQICIGFQPDELEFALAHEAEVEAHGLGRKALVFTVIAAAIAAPTAAQAHPTGAPGSPTGVSGPAPAVLVGGAHQAIPATAPGAFNPATTVGGAGQAVQNDVYAADFNPATTVGGAGGAVEGARLSADSPALTVGGAQPAIEASTPTMAAAVSVGGAIPAASSEASPAAVVGGGSFNTPDTSSPAVMVGGGGPAPVAPTQATSEVATAPSSSSAASDLLNSDALALAGGAAIAITAAGFAAAATTRRRPVRPA